MSKVKPEVQVKETNTIFPIPLNLSHFVLLSFLLIMCITPVSANPPSSLVLAIDNQSSNLVVTITHLVEDPTSHYVKSVKIQKNGAGLIDESYTYQPSKTSFTYVYPVSVIEGDNLKVTAECNIAGSISSELRISPFTKNFPLQKTASLNFSPIPLWQFHAVLMITGFLLILLAIIIIYAGIKGRKYILHKISASLGAFFIILGLTLAFYMVGTVSGTHLRVPHGYLGVTTIVFLLFTLVIAIIREKRPVYANSLRRIHIYSGRISVLLVCITLISGIFTAGIV